MSISKPRKGYDENNHQKEDIISAYVRRTHETLFPIDKSRDEQDPIKPDDGKNNDNDPSKNNDKQSDEQTP
tara:strand:- start:26 stop:238 length:213 start_codon:yes stop_codon:yes gene_type:complete